MINLVSWLTASRTGRYLVAGTVSGLLLLSAVTALRKSGREAEKAKLTRKHLKDLQNAIKARDKINGMGERDLDEYLSGWMRDRDK